MHNLNKLSTEYAISTYTKSSQCVWNKQKAYDMFKRFQESQLQFNYSKQNFLTSFSMSTNDRNSISGTGFCKAQKKLSVAGAAANGTSTMLTAEAG